MPRCDVCGNDYDKAFQVIQFWGAVDFRQLRVRHPPAGADLRPLWMDDHRAQDRSGRKVLLLWEPRSRFGLKRGEAWRLGRLSARIARADASAKQSGHGLESGVPFAGGPIVSKQERRGHAAAEYFRRLSARCGCWPMAVSLSYNESGC